MTEDENPTNTFEDADFLSSVIEIEMEALGQRHCRHQSGADYSGLHSSKGRGCPGLVPVPAI
jgi:hypothetical protein